MRFGSLFSGIGGFDLGFERAGMECAWQVEIDDQASAVLSRHWPKVEKFKDVRHYGKRDLDTVDVICGGFPCQDLSIAGNRAGLAGERSGLWFEFHRIIEELKPGWVVIENVPGLLSSDGGRDFAILLRGLVELGYGVCWRVLDAQYFGLAQRRKRLFVVGHLGSGRAAEVLFEPEGGSWNHAPSRGASEEIARPVAHSTTTNHGDASQQTFVAYGGNNTSGPMDKSTALMSGDGRWHQDFESETLLVADPRNGNELDDVSSTLQAKESGGYSLNSQPVVAFRTSGNSGVMEQGGKTAALNTATDPNQQIIAWHNKQQAGEIRVQGDTVNAVTKQWGTGGNNVPFVGVRRLMPVECERLQGFPDDWTEGESDSARYRQLGNAVAVPVAEWIARRIIGCDL